MKVRNKYLPKHGSKLNIGHSPNQKCNQMTLGDTSMYPMFAGEVDWDSSNDHYWREDTDEHKVR